MTAVFGGLDRAGLELGPGLNLIEAPNEGGKSTWCAFWRAMLYGIDTRDRDRKGHLADKNRFQPWSGAPMEGELTLEWQGREITLRRGLRGNAPFGSFSAVYAGTEEAVPGLSASVCGEMLTGVGQEVFLRSAFLGGGNLAVTAAPELERRIAALVTTGQEDVSFSQGMERLRAWKNRRQVNRSTGEIPRLEGELARTEESLARIEELSARIAQLEGERAELEGRWEEGRQQARQEFDRRLAQAQKEYQRAQGQAEALESGPALPSQEELRGAQGELQYLRVLEEELRQGTAALGEAEEEVRRAEAAREDEHFSGLTGEEAAVRAAEEAAGWQEAVREGERAKKWGRLSLVLALLAAAGWQLTARLLEGPAALPWGLAGAAVLLLVLSLWSFRRERGSRELARSLLARYGVDTPEELTALARDYQARCQTAEKAAHKVEVIRAAVVERQIKREDVRSALLNFVHQFAPEARDMYGCSAALSRALCQDRDLALARQRAREGRRRLEDLSVQAPPLGVSEEVRERLEGVNARLNQARGALRNMGDPAALAAQREQLEEALAQRRLELEALNLAMDALTQANTRLQERFSPELNALTGEYLARLTGDRYQSVSLTRELEGFVRTREEVLPRSVLCLSRGTADQLYLAVRLAVCRLCLPERPPIVLDDALTAFDDRRLTLALELLRELAEEQQIILFTCQRREGESLAGVPGVTRIRL